MDRGSLIRTIVMAIALLNQILVSAGWEALPWSSEQIGQALTVCFTVASSLWAWWKNNYLSSKGKRQEVILRKAGAK